MKLKNAPPERGEGLEAERDRLQREHDLAGIWRLPRCPLTKLREWALVNEKN
jgi:hypothetical protein